MDEDVCQEIEIFQRALVKMFASQGREVVFMEMVRNLRKQPHCIIECIPLAARDAEQAPMYFKKAILEGDAEWTDNVRLIDTRKKSLKASIPKGFPYFHVTFNTVGGFAHVIEDEQEMRASFGKVSVYLFVS